MKTQLLSGASSFSTIQAGHATWRILLSLPLLALLLFLGSAPLACSSKSGCDDSKCAAGNKCIDPGTGTAQCELICTKQADCPANYHCAANKANSANYCQADGVKYNPGSGQWGAPCDPAKGLDNNSDCDTADQFWCYGRNPTDGEAFCTQFQCNSDKDCGQDYVCTTINNYPNVQTAKPCSQTATSCDRSTTTVCLPRTYCLPCATDIDCVGPSNTQGSCVAGTDGAKFCSYGCQNDGNCPKDAACDQNSGMCMPRAGVCVGTGNLCDPCHSDKDCPQGICATSPYSGEHYCTVKSTSHCFVKSPTCAGAEAYCMTVGETSSGQPVYGCSDSQSTTCDPSTNKENFGCPTSSTATPDVYCSIDNTDLALPVDQCFGIVSFGTGANAGNIDGCWTK